MDPGEYPPQASFTPPETLYATHPGLREKTAGQRPCGKHARISPGEALSHHFKKKQTSTVPKPTEGKTGARTVLQGNGGRTATVPNSDRRACCQCIQPATTVTTTDGACTRDTPAPPGHPERALSVVAREDVKHPVLCDCARDSKTFRHRKQYRSALSSGMSAAAIERHVTAENQSFSNVSARFSERTSGDVEREGRPTCQDSIKREYRLSPLNNVDDVNWTPPPPVAIDAQACRVKARHPATLINATYAQLKDGPACPANNPHARQAELPKETNDVHGFIKTVRNAVKDTPACPGKRHARQASSSTDEQSTALQLSSVRAAFPSKYKEEPKTQECLRNALKGTGSDGAECTFAAEFCTCLDCHNDTICYRRVCHAEAGSVISTCDSRSGSGRCIDGDEHKRGSPKLHTSGVARDSDQCSVAHIDSNRSMQASQRSAEPNPVVRSPSKHANDTSQAENVSVFDAENAREVNPSNFCPTPRAYRTQYLRSQKKTCLATRKERSEKTQSTTKKGSQQCVSGTLEGRGGHKLNSTKSAMKSGDAKKVPSRTLTARVPPLHPVLQHLSTRLTGKCENSELRSLTQIQQCVLIYVADVASRENAVARERLICKMGRAYQNDHVAKTKLEKTESVILHQIPLILPLDVSSGASHWLLDGIYRVRVSISTARDDKYQQGRIGTLSEMWHVLETLEPHEFSAVVASTNDTSFAEVKYQCKPLLEFHVHGGVDMRKDVEAITVQRVFYETTGLHQDFIHRLSVKFLLPVFTTEEFDDLIREPDVWSAVVRERAHTLLIRGAALLGNTCDYV